MFTNRALASGRRGFQCGSRAWTVAWARVKRKASQPCSSMASSGSITLPLVLDIFWPCSSRNSPWMQTSLNGGAPMWCTPLKIIRATQKKMMSKPVTGTAPGYQVSSSGVLSGQPNTLKGHSALENQVSRASESWVMAPLPQWAHSVGSWVATVCWPQSAHSQAGIRWPHQSWRLMHQSRMLRIQVK